MLRAAVRPALRNAARSPTWTETQPLVARTFADDFNRPNEPLEASPDWEHDGLRSPAINIDTNTTRALDGTDTAYKSPDLGSTSQYVQFSVGNPSAGQAGFICCRLADKSNYIGARRDASGIPQVYQCVAGSFTIRYGSGPAVIEGDTLRLEVEGTTFRFYHNGGLRTEGTFDASLTSTRQGLVCRGGGAFPWIDNFESGTL